MKVYITGILILCILFYQPQLNNCQSSSCHPSCGSQDEFGCTDFDQEYSYATNCKTCSFGYVGGGGDGVTGALCISGKCNKACVSCKDQTNLRCYICASGYFDPIQDPKISTPCLPCHQSCLSCVAIDGAGTLNATTNENACLICAPGYFDPDENVYFPSACQKCQQPCVACRMQADKCIACPAGHYSTNEILGGQCVPIPTKFINILIPNLLLMFLLVIMINIGF